MTITNIEVSKQTVTIDSPYRQQRTIYVVEYDFFNGTELKHYTGQIYPMLHRTPVDIAEGGYVVGVGFDLEWEVDDIDKIEFTKENENGPDEHGTLVYVHPDIKRLLLLDITKHMNDCELFFDEQ